MDYIALGKNIKTERKKQKLTQEKLSEKASLSSVFLSQIENGKGIPSLETLVNISLALNVSLDYIVLNGRKQSMVLENELPLLLKNYPKKEKDLLLDSLKYLLSRLETELDDYKK